MLTDVQARQAMPREKPFKIFDVLGLYLFISPKGTKSWRLKYRFGGKEDLATLGRYPDVSISEARKLRDEFRRHMAEGRDPKLLKRRNKLVGPRPDLSFEAVGKAWHKSQSPRWTKKHAFQVLKSMEDNLFVDLGMFDVKDIDKPLLLSVLRKVEQRGAIETARRLRQRAEAVFDYAEALGALEHNPALRIVRAMQPVPPKSSLPALVKINAVHVFIQAFESSAVKTVTKAASRFLALTAQRPGNVQQARWAHFHGIDWATGHVDDPRWVIPAAEMKGELARRSNSKFDHEVPLSSQSVELLIAVRSAGTGATYVFGGRGKADAPLSDNSLGLAYRRLGYANLHVPHGWRSSFSTIMNELGAKEPVSGPGISDREVIDWMLGHIPDGISPAELAYNRAKYWPARTMIAQKWSSLLLQHAPPSSTLIRARA